MHEGNEPFLGPGKLELRRFLGRHCKVTQAGEKTALASQTACICDWDPLRCSFC